MQSPLIACSAVFSPQLAEESVASHLNFPFFICQVKEFFLLLSSGQATPMAQE